ncbi:MAG: hypothetical protein ACJAS5_000764 [Lentimonas sp.]|jgi:hypothetical protein
MGAHAKDQGLIAIYFGYFCDSIIEVAREYPGPHMSWVRDTL